MPTLKVKLEFEVEIERVNESEDYGLSDFDVELDFKKMMKNVENWINATYGTKATVESDLTVKFDE